MSNKQPNINPAKIFESVKAAFPDFNCDLADLKAPTKEFVVTFYTMMIEEFGFAANRIMQPIESQLDNESHPELLADILPMLNLSRTLVNILQKVQPKSHTRFGLSDLMNPIPLRTWGFMSVLLNFHSYANLRMGSLRDGLEGIKNIQVCAKKLMEECEGLQGIKNNRACGRAKARDLATEMKKMKAKYHELEMEIKSIEQVSEKRQVECADVKKRVGRLQTEVAQQKEKLKQLEQQLVQSPDVLKNNHMHLEQKLSELQTKLEEAKESFMSKKQVIKNFESTLLSEDARLTLLNEVTTAARQLKDLETQHLNLQKSYSLGVEKIGELQVLEKKMKDKCTQLEEQLTTLQLQWEKNKSGLSETKRHIKKEQEDIVSKRGSEFEALRKQVQEVEAEIADMNDLVVKMNNHYKCEYEKLMEMEKKFTADKLAEYKAKDEELNEHFRRAA